MLWIKLVNLVGRYSLFVTFPIRRSVKREANQSVQDTNVTLKVNTRRQSVLPVILFTSTCILMLIIYLLASLIYPLSDSYSVAFMCRLVTIPKFYIRLAGGSSAVFYIMIRICCNAVLSSLLYMIHITRWTRHVGRASRHSRALWSKILSLWWKLLSRRPYRVLFMTICIGHCLLIYISLSIPIILDVFLDPPPPHVRQRIWLLVAEFAAYLVSWLHICSSWLLITLHWVLIPLLGHMTFSSYKRRLMRVIRSLKPVTSPRTQSGDDRMLQCLNKFGKIWREVQTLAPFWSGCCIIFVQCYLTISTNLFFSGFYLAHDAKMRYMCLSLIVFSLPIICLAFQMRAANRVLHTGLVGQLFGSLFSQSNYQTCDWSVRLKTLNFVVNTKSQPYTLGFLGSQVNSMLILCIFLRQIRSFLLLIKKHF